MQESAASSPSFSRLHEALLDYFSAPGKYQLSLREPGVLFGSVREILQIAAGRGAAAGHDEKLRQAAVFFIRAALLYPGADHYAVLGYASRAEAADVKERYRLLMRLTHPDFSAAGSAPWPADAAVRVNRAYEVLSSPVLRRDYDEQLGPGRPATTASSSNHGRSVPAVRRSEPSRSPAGKKMVAAIAVVLAAAGIALLLPRNEPDELVQRAATPPTQKEHQAQVKAASETAAQPATLVSSDRLAAPQAPAPALAESKESAPPESVAVAEAPAAIEAPPVQQPAQPPVVERPAVQPPVTQPTVAQPTAVQPRMRPTVMPAPPHRAPAVAPRTTVARLVRKEPEPVLDTPIREWHEPPPAEIAAPAAMRRVEAPAVAPAVAIATPPAAPEPMALPIPLAAPPSSSSASAAMVARAVASVPAVLPVANSAPPLAPTLADAQPVLTQLLHVMESGKGEQLLRLLDAKARQAPGARGLSRQFDHFAEGGRPVHVSQVEFQGEAHEGVLLVTGRMRLHAGEPTIGSRGQKFVLKAEFITRGGKTTLTGLSGAAE